MSGFYVVSSAEGDSLRHKSILSGMLITDRSIIIDQGGWDSFEASSALSKNDLLEIRDGRFFVVKSFGGELVARVDSFGADAIFLYRNRGEWAFSNSFYELIKYCKSLGWPLVIDHGVLASMFVSGSIGRQLLSSQTPVAQINLVPPEKYISCNLNESIVSEKDLPVSVTKNIDYEESLTEWFIKWRSVLFSLAINSNDKISVDLSGGVDSRMLFGLVASSSAKERFEFFSQPHKPKDLAVAKSLCEKFDCTLNFSPPNWKALPIEFQYDAYCRGNMGFYNLPVTPPLHYSCSNIFKVNGVGGENLRSFYNGSGADWLKKIKKGLPRHLEVYEEDVSDLLYRSYGEFGIDPDDPNGMMVHYRKLRSRIIGGRNSFEKLKFNMVTPLTDPVLVDINDFSSRENGLEMYRDIMLAGGGRQLIVHPYDEEGKRFDDDFVDKSSFLNFSGSSLWKDPEIEYSVYASDLGASLSSPPESFEFDGLRNLADKIDKESRLARDSLDFSCVPPAFFELYESDEWSGSEGRKGAIETITWHAVLKLLNLG
uniref:hypothetical protein n=1 Tax=uncultured Halomonas sp. TaxID=173971 RepID=UPI0026266B0E|nr:hypothetical protein [uncultured Halomonas sp.]